MARAPATEEFFVTGPAGCLEALLEFPAQLAGNRVAVICHPHPQHQGTMLNKVVHTLARAMNELGMPALRFNFRGVGLSEGSYGGGDGEIEDVLAVVDYARRRWLGAGVWLAGFSFGAVVSARAAAQAAPEQLISIAPAVNFLGTRLETRPDMPWLIVQGSDDEIVPAAAVSDWVASCGQWPGRTPQLIIMPGVGHFFHGELVNLRNELVNNLAAGLSG